MSIEFQIVLAIIALVALYFAIPYGVGTYIRFRGKRVITCPETRKHAAVEVDVKRAALTAAIGHADLRLKSCTRWPERQDCGQECLLQIEISPEECLLRNMLAAWYQGKSCAFCAKPFHEISWSDHKPSLMNRERAVVEWDEIRPELIDEVLATHAPVCWDCANLQRLRSQYPDLMFERPPREIARIASR